MSTRLSDIVRAKKGEIAARKGQHPVESLRQNALYHLPRRPFAEVFPLGRLRVIAEVKKASPSRGVIRHDFDHRKIARGYEEGGAAAISILTDREFFQGDPSFLSDIRRTTTLPLLMKDFILDEYQIEEARALGADAILLILAVLDQVEFQELHALAAANGLESIVEVHDEAEMERAQASGAGIIGVNNRDLRTFETKIETSVRLSGMIPPGCVAISESGISDPAQGVRLRRLGYRGVLIGESFMKKEDPGRALAEFVEGVE